MILPHPGGGDCTDGSDIVKINELVAFANRVEKVVSAQPHLVQVQLNGAGLVIDFSGLINALALKGIDLTIL